MSLQAVPTLGQLAADPGRIKDLSPEVARELLAQIVGLQTVLLARALQPHAGVNGQPEAPMEDRLLDVREAARKLGLSADYLYRHAKALPFTVRIPPRQLRFSLRGIERYIRQRQGR